jgi:hypothetical protein
VLRYMSVESLAKARINVSESNPIEKEVRREFEPEPKCRFQRIMRRSSYTTLVGAAPTGTILSSHRRS